MTRYARTPEVMETAVDDELFVVLPGGEEIFHLNAMAAALWRALAEPASNGELTELFQAAFPELKAQQLAADLRETLRRLHDDGLLTEAGS